MNTGRSLAVLCACLALMGSVVRAQFGEYPPKDLIVPSLVADTTAVQAGKPFTVGVRLKIKAGWHTYWEFPGDAGDPPKIDWNLPEGFKAGPIAWPIPEAHTDEPDLLSYIFAGELLLPVQITPPAQLPAGEVVLKAKLRWLVCEKTCIPGQGNVELKLPAGPEAAPANVDLFAESRKKLPKSDPPFKVTWDRQKSDEFSLRVEGVPADQKVEFYPLAPENAKPGHPKVSPAEANGTRLIQVPIAEGGAPNLPWRGVLVTAKAGGPREGWEVSAAQGKSVANASTSVSTPAAPSTTAANPTAEPPPALFKLLFFAFLGGLILNVMPCVLPVIALKIFGFVKQAGDEPGRIFRMGLAFVAGVFVFFLGLATAVVVLKSLGRGFNWGFQFQNAYLFAGLIALVFVFGLNMLGVFEVTLSSEATSTLSKLSSKEGYSGAFLHGMFTTLLGTSCTAPFLGTTLGYAATQRSFNVFAIFFVIAAGMSLPYLLLTANPAWMRFIPKPGVWMERAKQLMGFVLLGVAVWLLGIFAESRPESVAGLIHYLLALALACWIFGTIQRRWLAGVLAVLIAVAGYFTLLQSYLEAQSQPATSTAQASGNSDSLWKPFSEESFTGGIERGQPVLIDFTAEWCINCKFYERTVLDTQAVQAALSEKNVLMLRADWTKSDPVVTKWLQKFGRIGVPLYVLYRPGEEQPVVFPDILTQQNLLHQLSLIKG